MEIGRHRGMNANEHIRVGSNSYEKVKTLNYLGSLVTSILPFRLHSNVALLTNYSDGTFQQHSLQEVQSFRIIYFYYLGFKIGEHVTPRTQGPTLNMAFKSICVAQAYL